MDRKSYGVLIWITAIAGLVVSAIGFVEAPGWEPLGILVAAISLFDGILRASRARRNARATVLSLWFAALIYVMFSCWHLISLGAYSFWYPLIALLPKITLPSVSMPSITLPHIGKNLLGILFLFLGWLFVLRILLSTHREHVPGVIIPYSREEQSEGLGCLSLLFLIIILLTFMLHGAPKSIALLFD